MTFGTRSAWLAVLLGLVACGDDSMPSPEPGPEVPVVVRTDAADVATCPHGGVVVRSGPDRNGNGALDDGEVAAATPVCQDAAVVPEPPPPVLVRLDDEPAGEVCANGGTAVRSGADTDRDGVLDDDEITATDHVCDESLLTRMESEPAGANCVGGGIAFHIGRDGDGDGVLGADEVEWTEYECTDVLSRTVTVATAADLAVLADIRVINGSLQVVGTSITALELPALELVGGRIVVEDNAALTRVSMPALVAVDGYLGLSLNPRLVELDLGTLRRVEGALYVLSNAALTTLAGLDALLSVDRGIEILNNERLTAAALPSLGLVGGDITVSGNPTLTALELSLFERAGDLVVIDNAALAAVELRVSALLCSGCPLPVGAVEIADNTKLATVELHATSFEAVTVVDNDAATGVTLWADRVDGDMTIRGPALAEVAMHRRSSLDDRVVIGGRLSIQGPVTELMAGLYGADVGGLLLEGTQLTDLDRNFPYVRGHLALYDNDALIRAEFLEATGGIRIVGNDALRWFHVFEPEIMAGDVVIAENAVLESAAGLQNVREIQGSLSIIDNPRLRMPALYGLQHVEGDVRLAGLPALEYLTMHSLTTIGGGLSVTSTGLRTWSTDDIRGLPSLRSADWVTVNDNQALEDIDLPVLVAARDWLIVHDNPALRRLGLPALEHVDSIHIWDNIALPVCEIQELFARTAADVERQEGNDEDGTCE